MPINENDWSSHFTEATVPSFPCPSCSKGKLKSQSPPKISEPGYSSLSRDHEHWEIEWSTYRALVEFRCDESVCGEVAFMICDAEYVETYDDDSGRGLERLLVAKAFHPAPPMFQVPKDTPEAVAQCLKDAFQLYWTDLSACANRLRLTVELLLDHFRVPRNITSQSRKKVVLPLAARIDKLKTSKWKEAFTAIRWIGNEGAHQLPTDQSREVVFKALNIIELVVVHEFQSMAHERKMAKEIKAIIKKKGRIKKKMKGRK